MNCIFCHEISDNSKSVEHIIPESLGNKEHVLWKEAVCDKCNNYFAVKVEKELLNQPYFISLRNRNVIKTKRNHFVPKNIIVSIGNEKWAEAIFEYYGNIGTINGVIPPIKGKIIAPIFIEPEPNNYILSRFLAKCAYEYLVYRIGKEKFPKISEYLKDKQLETLRKYARYGEGCKIWSYSQRRIYGEGDIFTEFSAEKSYEILNEMDFLAIELERKTINDVQYVVAELYYVLVIMGIEYVINIAEPDISGYYLWLQQNNFKSPIFRHEEQRMPNTKTNTPQITEELIKKIKNK